MREVEVGGRQLRVAAALALVVGVGAACGGGGGERSAPTTSAAPALPASSTLPARDDGEDRTTTTREAPETTLRPPSVFPDLVGLTFEAAEDELVQYNVRITKKPRISPERPGTVVEQEPVAGSAFEQRVTLYVSVAPPAVPEVVGMTFGEAKDELEQLGFSLVEVPVFDEERVDGYVLSQDPAAGATNIGEVTLQVARRPVVSYLSETRHVEKHNADIYVGNYSANGHTFTRAVAFVPYRPGGYVDFDLGRKYRRVVADIGLNDGSNSTASYRIEILGDGRELYAGSFTLGQLEHIELDVTGVLRLRLYGTPTSRESGTIVFGDISVQGLDTEVPTTTMAKR